MLLSYPKMADLKNQKWQYDFDLNILAQWLLRVYVYNLATSFK